jgi:tetratricopeptide (TPR) repeat protein
MALGAYGLRPPAVVAFANAERLQPGEPRWPYFQAVALAQEGAEEKAGDFYRRAVALTTGAPDAPQLRLAELLLRQNHPEEAQSQFEAIVARSHNHPAAFLGLARIALMRGQAQAAVEDLSVCLKSPNVRKAAHLLLAEAEQQLGDGRSAEAALAKAATLPPDTPWPDPFLEEIDQLKLDRTSRISVALRLHAQGRTEEYERATVELEKDYPGSSYQLDGRRLFDAQDYPAAAKAFRRSAELDPTFAQATYWHGLTLLKMNDVAGATAQFRATLRLQPQHAGAFDNLSRCLVLSGDRAGAIEALHAGLLCMPQQADLHQRLATLLAEDGRDEEALAQLEQALSLQADLSGAREAAETIRKRLKPKAP